MEEARREWLAQIAEGLANRGWSYGYGNNNEGEGGEEEVEDVEMEGEEDVEGEEEEEESDEEEVEEDDLPDLLEPPPQPDLPRAAHYDFPMEVPDDPIDDAASIVRRVLQDFGYNHHQRTELLVKRVFVASEAARKCTTEEEAKKILFGWESLEWRKKYFTKPELTTYAQALYFKSVWDFNEEMRKSGWTGNFFSFNEPSLDNIPPHAQKLLTNIRHLPRLLTENDLRLIVWLKEQNAVGRQQAMLAMNSTQPQM